MGRGARRLGPMMEDTLADLAQFHHLQAGQSSGGEVWTILGEDAIEVVLPPPLPDVDRRIRDLTRAGWGTLAHPLFYGLLRTGMKYGEALAEIEARVRDGRLVLRGGRWQSWASRSWTATWRSR